MYPEAPQVFRELNRRGLPIAVISRHPQENLRKEAERYGLLPFIRLLISTKNKKEAILKACQDFGVNPRQFLYLGDTTFDIRAGKKAGVVTSGISTGYHLREKLEEEKPDYIFDNLEEVLGII
jgi:HAD superfamily hydrolase (TIGR01549 family)